MTFARLFVALVAGLFLAPVWAAPQIQQWTTTNGARVLFVETHAIPMVEIKVVFDAGAARDTRSRSGLAMLANTLLTDGAGALNAEEIAERLEGLGAELGSSSMRDMAIVQLRSLSQAHYLDPALKIFADVLARPSYPETALERERERALTALAMERQSPQSVASRAFYEALYGDHPYALRPGGSEEGLTAIDRADLQAFHARFYTAANAVVAMVGDLDRGRARSVAERLSAGLARGEPAPPLPPVPELTKARTVRIEHPSTQTHILVGQPGVSRLDPDYFPLYVGNYTLGGGGFASRMLTVIREENGLAYSASSGFTPMRRRGPFVAGLQTRVDQTERALGLARETLSEFVRTGPSAEELSAAKKHLTGSFPLNLDSNGKIADILAVIGFYGLPLDYLDTYIGRVEAVTLDSVRDAYARRIHPQRMITVIVGPQQAP